MDINISDFHQAHVLVCGDLMLDRYWQGPTSRVSPEAPVPVVKIDSIENRAGGAGNVALNIATLGASVDIMGVIGQDANGEVLCNILNQPHINTRVIRDEKNPTITKLRVISRHQQLIRLDFEEELHHVDFSPLYRDFEEAVRKTDIVVLSDYGKGVLQDPQRLIEIARAHNKPVLVDPKGTDFAKYAGATLLTPNLSEFEAVVGPCATEDEIVDKAQALISTYNLDALLVTRSEKGMSLIQREQPAVHLPTWAREVFDVTGAGDTVISVLATALAAGEPLEIATALSNAAAGIAVGRLGTATVTSEELRRELRHASQQHAGLFTEEALMSVLEEARLSGERIVMTNGCFDLIHPGHIQYLREAKALGDRLLVAVNTDASVKRLKGDSRPINDVEHRMAVLSGLESVDWVVPFEEDTPERLISRVLPDILVKGGDYKPEHIAGGRQVIENGGSVQVLSFTDNCSTTSIIDRISATNQ